MKNEARNDDDDDDAILFVMKSISIFITALTSLSIPAISGFHHQNAQVQRRQILGTRWAAAASSAELNSVAADVDDPKRIAARVFATDKRPVILFDGVCNMCNNAVNLALDWDPKGKLRFSALQSNVGKALLEANGRNADDISSIVLVTKNGAYIKSDAVLKIAEELTPLPVLPLKPVASLGMALVPKVLRDVIYDGVADNRYSIMGKRDECRFGSEDEFEDRFVDDKIAYKLN